MKKALGFGVLVIALGLWFFFRAPAPPSTTLRPQQQPAEAPFFEVRTQPPRGDASIRGVVYDGLTPLEGITLVATRIDDEENLAALECEAPCTLKRVDCEATLAGEGFVEWVEARRGEAPPVARTTSRGDGTFELSGLRPGLHRVWVTGEGRGVALVSKVAAGEQALEVAFGNEVEVSGRVVGASRVPVVGATVTGFFPDAPHFFHVRTGPDGTFSLGRLPVGRSLALLVTGPGGLFRHQVLGPIPREGFRGLTGGPLEVSLLPAVERVVRVLHDGRAVSGARVAWHEGAHETAWRTNAQGEVRVTFRTFELPELTATAADLVGETVATDGDEVIVIELGAAQWLEGSVADDAQHPLRDASVTCGLLTTRTDAAGHYRLGPLSVGAFAMVDASAPGYVKARSEQKTRGQPVDFALVRAAPVEGRVVDAQGQPLGDATVWLKGVGVLPPTDADGVFSFDDARVGDYTLEVVHPMWGQVSRQVSAPAPGLEVRMERGASLDVTVVDEGGKPLRVTVGVTPDCLLSEFDGRSRQLETDRQGRASFYGLLPGAHLALATDASGQLRVAQRFELGAGGHVEVRLVHVEGLAISGLVVDGQGRGVPNVRVMASPDTVPQVREARASLLFEAGARSARANTDATGAFTLRHLPPGRYRVKALETEQRAPAGADAVVLKVPTTPHAVGMVVDSQRRPVTTALVQGREVDATTGAFRVPIERGTSEISVWDERYPERSIELPSPLPDGDVELGVVVLSVGRSVRVQVVDATSGRGLKGVRMRATPQAIRALPPATDESGFATLSGLGDDEVFLTATSSGFGSASMVVASTAIEARVELQPEAQLVISVFDAQGRLDPMARVSTLLEGNRVLIENGHLSAPAGTYQLVVENSSRHRPIAPVEVSVVPGETRHIDLR